MIDTNNYKPDENSVYVLSTLGVGYQGFTNTTALITTARGRELEFCIDTGSSLSLIADSALREFFPDIMVSTIAEGQLVKLTGIGDKGPVMNRFVNLPITMKTLDGGTVRIVDKTHVVDQLSCNMLISNNILRTNYMDIS